MQRTHEESVKKLYSLVKDIGYAMMTTAAPDGTLHSRPMATLNDKFDGILWFFTGFDTGKVDEIERDHNVNVSYAKPEDNVYVSVSGVARVLRDTQKAKELWSPILKAWFPEGPEDPNLGVIRVEVHSAEYWDSPSSKVVQLIGFAKAVLTGKRSDGEGNEHGKIQL